MNRFLILKQAEDFCLQDGENTVNWFREHYARYREYHGVLESVEATMRALDLYYQFQQFLKGAENE